MQVMLSEGGEKSERIVRELVPASGGDLALDQGAEVNADGKLGVVVPASQQRILRGCHVPQLHRHVVAAR